MRELKSKVLAFLLTLNVLGATSPVSASQANFVALRPGEFQRIEQNMPINIVFVGYQPGSGPREIQEADFRSILPQSYRSVNRAPHFYGLNSPTGVGFSYDYNIVYANSQFENAYFAYLSSIAKPDRITAFQDLYNQQHARTLTVNQNHKIDATAAERWLGDHSLPMLGVDPSQYTIFFVNWYGRTDFKFHGYVMPDEPDPDTGVNRQETDLFGFNQFQLSAWGGTAPDDAESGYGSLRRVWFFDLSAGPEYVQYGWNIDDADTTGDGELDYRLPHIWEYGNVNGYRPFNTLSYDLGLVTRFAAINLLFTTSPVYDVALSAPKLPSSIQLNLTLFQGDPDLSGKSRLHTDYALQKISKLQPLSTFSVLLKERPLTGRFEEIFKDWIAFTPSYGNNHNAQNSYFGNFYLYYQSHLNQFMTGDADYEVPILALMSATSYWPPDRCQCSFADDNYKDGTQSMIVLNLSNFFATRGFGFTEFLVHEVGHHLGMSHPHDGYDSELNIDYNYLQVPVAGLGDESSTVMSYTHLNLDFSQFDRDNMNRWLTAGYINEANAVLGLIQKSPRAGEAASRIASADGDATSALASHQAMDYAAAHAFANSAYRKIVAAAAQINVKVEAQAYQADYKSHGTSSKFVDMIPYDRLGTIR